jgi:hypothetical protein
MAALCVDAKLTFGANKPAGNVLISGLRVRSVSPTNRTPGSSLRIGEGYGGIPLPPSDWRNLYIEIVDGSR